MIDWQTIETARRDVELLFWIRSKTVADGTYFVDSSGNPIVAQFKPQIHIGQYGTWSSLSKATHWMPIPQPPTTPSKP